MKQVIAYIQELMGRLPHSNDPYTVGYVAALEDLAEYIMDELWEAGEDGEEA